MVNDNNVFLVCFHTKEEGANFLDVVEMYWPNVNYYCSDLEVKDKKFALVILKLGFRILYGTLKQKLGPKILKDISYLQKQNLLIEFDKQEEVIEKAKGNLRVCFNNEIPSIDIEEQAEKEQQYKARSSSSSFEPVAKKARW